MNKVRLRIIALVSLASFVTGVVVSHENSMSVRDDSKAHPTAKFGTEQVNTFESLRGHSTSLPIRLRKKLRAFRDRRVRKLWFGTAKRIKTGDGSFWVVNGPSEMCIVQATRGAISCDRYGSVLEKGLALGVFAPAKGRDGDPDQFTVLGLAPDWASIAWLRVGRQIETVAITHNGYSLAADSPILLERLQAG
jgi:hypothetical protein